LNLATVRQSVLRVSDRAAPAIGPEDVPAGRPQWTGLMGVLAGPVWGSKRTFWRRLPHTKSAAILGHIRDIFRLAKVPT